MSVRALLNGPKLARQLQGSFTLLCQGVSSQAPNFEQPSECESRKTRIDIDFEELHEILNNDDSILIDVRNASELQSGSIPGSINIPLKQVKSALEMPEDQWAQLFQSPKPSKRSNKNLIFYARGPNASSTAVEIAHRLGFKESRRYTGGWADYCEKMGIPLTKKTPT